MNDQATADQMRRAVAQFIAAVHSSYVREASVLSPAARAGLPLFSAGRFAVAVGTRYLHVVATAENLAVPGGADASIEDSHAPLSWAVGFFDPVVLVGLADLDETVQPAILGVRLALGVRTVLYHFTIGGGSTLDPHRAVHVAARLFSAHRAAADELDTIRQLVPGQEELVDEMAGAAAAGLARAHALLACALAPGEPELVELCEQGAAEPAQVRRALSAALRRRAQAQRA
jgi:hypothetical protein